MSHDTQPPKTTEPAPEPDPRPRYEPPRVSKKRSVSRATLFTGAGASAQGIVTEGPP